MSARKFGVGQSLKRVEDVRLVTGQGRYAADVSEGAAQGGIPAQPARARALHHRRSRRLRAMPGVRAVFTAADFADLGGLPCLAPVDNADGRKLRSNPIR